MRFRRALGLFLVLGFAIGDGARAGAPGLPPDMGQYVLALLRKGPAWSATPSDAGKQTMAGHMANIHRLIESGQMAVAGPVDGDGDLRGIFIFNTRTVAEARKLAETDPAVKAGRFVVDLHVWYGPAAIANIAKSPPRHETPRSAR